MDQIGAEVAALRYLVEHARRVRDQGRDSKLTALRTCLSGAQFQELKDCRGKLLIFTEHRDTLTYIRQNLEQWGYHMCEIHGGMNPHERKQAQDIFRTQSQICIATEAAGEGINLQFCHLDFAQNRRSSILDVQNDTISILSVQNEPNSIPKTGAGRAADRLQRVTTSII
jgi:ERCC4-related helicase